MRRFAPQWKADDMRTMTDRFQSDGMRPAAGDIERLTRMPGRPLRTYRDFARETATGAAG